MAINEVRMYLTRLWYLKRTNILQNVPIDRLGLIMHMTSMSRVGRYQDICFPGESTGSVFMIQSGSIKISRLLENGRSLTLDVLYTGDVYGEMAEPEASRRNEYAEAVDNVVISATTRLSFEALLEERPELHFTLLSQRDVRPEEIKMYFKELAFKSSIQRIMDILNVVSRRFGKESAGGIEVPVTPYDIAVLAGISPQAATFVLYELRQLRLLDYTEDSLLLRRPELPQRVPATVSA